MVIAIVALAICGWFWPESDPRQNWCEEKEISVIIGCDKEKTGCAYKMADGSLDASEAGKKVGDKVQVCRKDKPRK